MARSRADEGMGSSERQGRRRGAAGWERRARRKGTANKEVLSVAAKPPHRPPSLLPLHTGQLTVPFAPRALARPRPRFRRLHASYGSLPRGTVTCCLLPLDGSCPLSADVSGSPALRLSSGEARPAPTLRRRPGWLLRDRRGSFLPSTLPVCNDTGAIIGSGTFSPTAL